MSVPSERAGSANVLEVEFSIRDSSYPFVAITEREACTMELAEMVPRGDGRYAEFFHVSGVEPRRFLDTAGGRESLEVSLLRAYDDGGLFEFLASGSCPARTLAELGALPREASSVDGEGRIVVEIPSASDSAAITAEFLDENPGADLEAKREKETFTPLFGRAAFRDVLTEELTERQREVLRAAFDAGYYDWPRGAPGTEIAADLDISSPTFSEHIHAAERKLLAVLFEDPTRG